MGSYDLAYGLVPLGKSGTGAAVVLDEPTNKMDKYLLAQGKQKKDIEFEDDEDVMSALGGVWDRDTERLTNDFLDYKKTLTNYERAKDAKEKGTLYKESVTKYSRLKTNIMKSKQDKKTFLAYKDDIDSDSKFLYGDDANTKMEEWASTGIERSETPSVQKGNSLDAQNAYMKKIQGILNNNESVAEEDTKLTGNYVIRTGEKYYTQQQLDNAKEEAWKFLPENQKRALRYQLAQNRASVDPATAKAANDVWDMGHNPSNPNYDPNATDAYLKDVMYSSVEPGLIAQQKSIKRYVPPPRSYRSGSGTKQTGWQATPGYEMSDDGTTEFSYVSMNKEGGDSGETNFRLNVSDLKRMASDTSIPKDVRDEIKKIVANNPADTTWNIKGRPQRVYRKRNSDEIPMVELTATSMDFLSKFQSITSPIYVSLQGNEGAVNAFTGKDDIIDLLVKADEIEANATDKTLNAPTGKSGTEKEKKAATTTKTKTNTNTNTNTNPPPKKKKKPY
jgi:hypothetical protein